MWGYKCVILLLKIGKTGVQFPYAPQNNIGGLLGIFYRNCLKVEDMIFHPLYSKVFVPMIKSGNRFLHFIAYPLGFCIYCSTFWITMAIGSYIL